MRVSPEVQEPCPYEAGNSKRNGRRAAQSVRFRLTRVRLMGVIAQSRTPQETVRARPHASAALAIVLRYRLRRP
jgi:hypothetical protein